MKTCTVTVNGKAYAVTIKEGVAAGAVLVVAAPVVALASAAAPAAAPALVTAPVGTVGSVQVATPMPGKVAVVKSAVGQAVKKGDVILALEVMKMENDIVAPRDGTITSINASTGDSVESGAALATLN